MLDMPERWPAPAKLNLFLHVCGRRDDGYHLLQTVFQLLDYGDTLRFELRHDGRVRRPEPVPDVPEGEDLCVRAAELLRVETGCRLGADIFIDKRLPMGGGLGGGSSDAATTLVALNLIWGLGLEVDRLAALGLHLGADVPVFVRGGSAWAEGIGEQLAPVELGHHYYVVLHPGCHVGTGEVFGHSELTRNTPRIKMSAFRAGQARNDCEPVVRALYPEVGRALDWLAQYGVARLTGTGACVFAAFTHMDEARRVLSQVPTEWRAFVAKGVDVSPLRSMIERWSS